MADGATFASLVEQLLVLPFLIMGVSHIVQPKMWRDFFTRLHAEGPPGVVTRTFALELWPAMMVVAFHQVWSGPGIVVTLYGHLLTTKITLSMLKPALGLRSLALAERKGDNGFRVAGVVLCGLSGWCAALSLGWL